MKKKIQPCLPQQLPLYSKAPNSKKLFDQLGLTAKDRKIATEALVSIASEAGVECLTAKIANDKALLQELTEITFSNKDMEVGCPDNWRPLY